MKSIRFIEDMTAIQFAKENLTEKDYKITDSELVIYYNSDIEKNDIMNGIDLMRNEIIKKYELDTIQRQYARQDREKENAINNCQSGFMANIISKHF